MKGFFFSVMTVLFFSLLVATIVVFHQRTPAAQLWADWATTQTLASANDDVSEEVFPLFDINVTTYQNNLTLVDRLPAPRNIVQTLDVYAQFTRSYYAPPFLAIAFLAANGQEIALSQLSPPLQVIPFGFNYTYPSGRGEDWGKRELEIRVSEANFSYLPFLSLQFTVTNASFAQNFSLTCEEDEDWEDYKPCRRRTTLCLNASLRVTDQNGRSYLSPCRNFDAGFQNKIRIDFTENRWFELRLGKVEDSERVLLVRFQDLDVRSNTTFSFNQSTFAFNAVANVRVTHLASNASLTKAV